MGEAGPPSSTHGGRQPSAPPSRGSARAVFLALMARVEPIVGSGAIRMALRVLARYDLAGGSLLASGLAYTALFAFVPAILLLLGISGAFVADPKARLQIVVNIGTVLPPLRGLVITALDQVSQNAAPLSAIGVIGLVWGASRFYVALETAMANVFATGAKRNFFLQTLLGLVSVVALVAAVLLATFLAGLASYLQASVVVGVTPAPAVSPITNFLAGVLLNLVGPVAAFGAVVLVYVVVPPHRASWRAILLPAVAVAIALTAVTLLFVYAAPRLIGAAAVLGTLATVFAALAWLGLSFQALLLGAAWAREREDDRVEAGST
jgi:membrane protein